MAGVLCEGLSGPIVASGVWPDRVLVVEASLRVLLIGQRKALIDPRCSI